MRSPRSAISSSDSVQSSPVRVNIRFRAFLRLCGERGKRGVVCSLRPTLSISDFNSGIQAEDSASKSLRIAAAARKGHESRAGSVIISETMWIDSRKPTFSDLLASRLLIAGLSALCFFSILFLGPFSAWTLLVFASLISRCRTLSATTSVLPTLVYVLVYVLGVH